MKDMLHDFLAGDWWSFFEGGPIRRTIYKYGKRIIQWFDTLDL